MPAQTCLWYLCACAEEPVLPTIDAAVPPPAALPRLPIWPFSREATAALFEALTMACITATMLALTLSCRSNRLQVPSGQSAYRDRLACSKTSGASTARISAWQ